MSQKPAEELSYEEALDLFDARLRSLEEGKLTLEEAILAVEEGRGFLKICEAKLEAARHKIEVRPDPAAKSSEFEEMPPPEDRLL